MRGEQKESERMKGKRGRRKNAGKWGKKGRREKMKKARRRIQKRMYNLNEKKEIELYIFTKRSLSVEIGLNVILQTGCTYHLRTSHKIL